MATFTQTISSNSNDWQITNMGSDMITVNEGSNKIFFGQGITSETYSAGFRFTSVTIPQGATINSAYCSFYLTDAATGNITMRYYGEDVDDAAAHTTASNWTSATRTTAYTEQNIYTGWSQTTNAYKDAADISAVIQEIVDRAGWASGNDINILVVYQSAASTQSLRVANGATANGAKITIDYTASGNTYNETGSGGVVASGTATIHGRQTIATSGGVKLSGFGGGVFNPGATGGALCSGSATVSKGKAVSYSIERFTTNSTDWQVTGSNLVLTEPFGLIYFGVNGSSQYYHSGYNFTNITIPSTATITSAVVTLRVGDPGESPNSAHAIDIWGEDVDDAAAHGSITDWNNAVRTTATVGDVIGGSSEAVADGPIDFADISTIITEIIARPGWSSGNDINILMETTSAGINLGFYNGGYFVSAYRPKIVINYTIPHPVIDEAPGGNSGVLVSGTSINSITEDARGGVVCGGSARVALTIRSISASGGARANSTATFGKVMTNATSGGVRANSTATFGKVMTNATSGGVRANSTATFGKVMTNATSGGVRANSTATFGKVMTNATSGGVRAAGVAAVYTINNPQFSRGYEFALTVHRDYNLGAGYHDANAIFYIETTLWNPFAINRIFGFMNFPRIDIDQGAKIVSAYMKFSLWSNSELSNPGETIIRFEGHDVDNSLTGTDGTWCPDYGVEEPIEPNMIDPPLTTAYVDQDWSVWATTGTYYNTNDLSSIIEEIIGRAGWAPGNDLSLYMREIKAEFAITDFGIVAPYQGEAGPGYGPVLYITAEDSDSPAGPYTGGTARVSLITQSITTSGGAKVNGSATFGKVMTNATSGGVKVNGSATFGKVMTNATSGGVKVNGSATFGKVMTNATSGGVRAAGVAAVYTINNPQFGRGYEFKLTTHRDYDVSGGYHDSNGTFYIFDTINSPSYINKLFAFMNFPRIDIDQGAKIVNAYMKFALWSNSELTNPGETIIRFEGHDVDNSLIGTNNPEAPLEPNMTDPPLTTAYVDQDWSVWATTDTYYNTNDLSSVIEEIIGRAGWAPGNDLSLYMRVIQAEFTITDFGVIAPFQGEAGDGSLAGRLYITAEDSNSPAGPYTGGTAVCSVIYNPTAGRLLQEYDNIVLADSPTHYWRLSETSGSALNLGSTGTATNGTYSAGVTRGAKAIVSSTDFDTSAQFNGADYIDIPDHSTLNSSAKTAYSVEAWFNVTDTTARQTIYEQGGTSNGLNIYVRLGSIYVACWSVTSGWSFASVSETIQPNTNYQVVLVYDGSATTLKGYLNGALMGTNNTVGSSLSSHTGNCAIGAVREDSLFDNGSRTGDGDYFTGRIDEVAIWDQVALTESQIYEHWETGSANGIGIVVDGTAQVGQTIRSISTSGGVLVDGRAFNSVTEDARGGLVASGIARPTITEDASGGLLAGGSARSSVTENTSGGLVASGTAFNSITEDARGGLVASGSATVSQVIRSITTSGGVLADSRAFNSITENTSGGVVLSGIAWPTITEDARGGLNASGIAWPTITEDARGGLVASGIARPTITEDASGGVVLSGTAVPTSNNETATSGGALVNSTATLNTIHNPSIGRTFRDYDSIVLADNPTHYWRLSETSGVATNLGSTGSLTNGTYSAGVTRGVLGIAISTDENAAAQFNGADHVDIPDHSTLNTSIKTAYSVEAWFNITNTTARQVIYEQGGQSNGLGIYVRAGSVYVACWNGGTFYSVSTSILANTTYQVVLVYDGNNSQIKGYLNGLPIGASAASSTIPSHTGDAAIGATINAALFDNGENLTGGDYFTGIIDEVAIWDQEAIAESQVFGHWIAGSAGGSAIVANGTATVGAIFPQTATGGSVAGGTAFVSKVMSLTTSGGLRGAGLSQGSTTEDTSGGVVLSGIAWPTITEDARGGLVASGTALPTITEDARGGLVASGVARPTITEDTSGGAVLSGSARPTITEDASGGLVASGTAPVFVSRTITPTGGNLLSGSAQTVLDGEVQGGSVCGGSAIIDGTTNISTSGGVVLAGMTLAGSTNLVGGGVVIGGPGATPIYMERVIRVLDFPITVSSHDWQVYGSTLISNEPFDIIYFGHDGTNYRHAGFHIADFFVPAGAVIVGANMNYVTGDPGESPYLTISLQYRGEDVDDAAPHGSISDWNNATPTTASVGDSIGGGFPVVDTPVVSADISSIIQEIVDRPGWAYGNGLNILVTTTSSTTGELFGIYSADHPFAYNRPVLTLTYHIGDIPDNEIGSGGTVVNSTVIPTSIFNSSVISAGLLASGTAESPITHRPSATGGSVCSGSATVSFEYNSTGNGGIVASGTSPHNSIFNVKACDLDLNNSDIKLEEPEEDFQIYFTSGHGIDVSGSHDITSGILTVGGIVVGGSAYNDITEDTSGGILLSGIAQSSITEDSRGGVRAGGTTTPTSIFNITPSGGLVLNGTVVTQITSPTSGGAVVSSSKVYAQTITNTTYDWVRFGSNFNQVEALVYGSDIIYFGDASGFVEEGGFHFTSVNIPPGAKVHGAYLTFGLANTGSVTVRWYGENVGNASPHTTLPEFTGASLTAAYAEDDLSSVWSPQTINTIYKTSSVTAVIQEIVNRSDWISGNNINILGKRQTSTNSDVGVYSSIASVTSDLKPQLVVSFSSDIAETTYTNFNPSVSGGAVLSGSAFVSTTASSAGGLLASGSAITRITEDTSGGVRVGGTAITRITEDTSGGVRVGGAASQSLITATSGGIKVSGTVVTRITEDTSGGTILSGSARVQITSYISPAGLVASGTVITSIIEDTSGGVVLSGTAFVEGGAQGYDISGGTIAGGSAIISINTEGGGSVVGGEALVGIESLLQGGGILTDGTAVQNVTYFSFEGGGSVLSGSAQQAITNPTSGGTVMGGSARVSITEDTSGGIVLSGIAWPTITEDARGGMSASGVAAVSTTNNISGSGGVVIAGKARQTYIEIGQGGVVLGGGFFVQIWEEGQGGVNTSGSRSLYGRAAEFNGINQQLTCADNDELSMGDFDFGFTFWVNLDSTSQQIIASKGIDNTTAGLEWKIEVNASGKFEFVVSNGTTSTSLEWSASPSVGIWYFIAAWYDSTENYMYLQINDSDPISVSHINGSQNTAGTLRVGASPNSDLYLDGRIDSFGYWKRPFSFSERGFLYNNHRGRLYSEITNTIGLIAWWDFSEDSGDRIDSHGFNDLVDVNNVLPAEGVELAFVMYNPDSSGGVILDGDTYDSITVPVQGGNVIEGRLTTQRKILVRTMAF